MVMAVRLMMLVVASLALLISLERVCGMGWWHLYPDVCCTWSFMDIVIGFRYEQVGCCGVW